MTKIFRLRQPAADAPRLRLDEEPATSRRDLLRGGAVAGGAIGVLALGAGRASAQEEGSMYDPVEVERGTNDLFVNAEGTRTPLTSLLRTDRPNALQSLPAGPLLSFQGRLSSKQYAGPHRVIEFRGGTYGGATPPYDLSAWFDVRGAFLTGAYIVISNKRFDIDGQIMGVSARPDGSEPSMLAVSPDVNGPAVAVEARGNMGPGFENQVALAVYDNDHINAGKTPYSRGYGTKRFALSGRGAMMWGADLSDTPLTAHTVRLERSAEHQLTMTTSETGAGIFTINALGSSATLRLQKGGVTVVSLSASRATQAELAVAGNPVARFNATGSVCFGGQNVGGQRVLSAQSTNGGLAVLSLLQATVGAQRADMLQATAPDGQKVLSRISPAGYYMTRKTTAPADTELAASELAIWFDTTPGSPKLMVKGKLADGTVTNGAFPLQ
jgi:hypothetical protein